MIHRPQHGINLEKLAKSDHPQLHIDTMTMMGTANMMGRTVTMVATITTGLLHTTLAY